MHGSGMASDYCINVREEKVGGGDGIKESKRSRNENGAKQRRYISSYHHLSHH